MKKIIILFLIFVIGCTHLNELPNAFVSKPPKEIQIQYELALDDFSEANKLISSAFKNEKISQQLTQTDNINSENYLNAIRELNQAKLNLEKSIQKNKEGIRILQKLRSTKDPSINQDQMRNLIQLKLYGNLLSTQTIECHNVTIRNYNIFSKSDFSNSTALKQDYKDCNNKRIFVEEYIMRQSWLDNATISSPLPGLELNQNA